MARFNDATKFLAGANKTLIMAQKIEHPKGFKIIECTGFETKKFGGIGICDSCNESDFKGYYIAVLNSWYCTACYEDWSERANRHPEDEEIENRNYEAYSRILLD